VLIQVPLSDMGVSKPPHVHAALRELALQVLAAADGHLAAADALHARDALPSAAMPAFLPAVPARRALAQLRAAGGDPFAHGLGYWSELSHGGGTRWARLRLQLALMRHALMDTF
jgi:hypothetical protein